MSQSKTVRGHEEAAFLRDAFMDYLGARVLLLADLPEQGAILCSTAIEKCAKAVMTFHGEKPEKEHLGAEHWSILQTEPNYGGLLNGEFVELSRVAYKLRYSWDLPFDYNLVIASREFLAEMDHTISSILSRFRCHVNGNRRFTGYEGAIARGDKRLIADNHLVTGEPVAHFVSSKPQTVYEVRRDSRGLMESRYATEKVAKRPGFLRAGLVAGENPLDCDLSHFSIRGSFSLVVDGIEHVGRESNSETW